MRFALVLLLAFTFSAHASIGRKSSVSDGPSVTYTKHDLIIAREINDLFKHLKRNRLPNRAIFSLDKKLKKTEVFSDIKWPIKRLIKISKMESKFPDFRKRCQFKTNDASTPLAERIYKLTEKYCRGKFVSLLLTKKHQSKLNKKNFKYLSKSLPYYLAGEHKKQFRRFLTNINKNSPVYLHFSTVISNLIMEKNLRLTPKVVDHIYHSSHFTNYLRERGYFKREERQEINKNFNSLVRRLTKSIKKKDTEKATKLADEMLVLLDKNISYISKGTAWVKLITTGKSFRYIGDNKRANHFFRHSLIVAEGDKIDESLFQIVWDDILKSDYKAALGAVDKYNMIGKYAKLNSKLRFWISYIAEKNDETHLAKHLYSELIDHSPMNYYSIIALKQLNSLEDKAAKSNYLKKISSTDFHLNTNNGHYSKFFIRHMKRLSIWLELDIESFSMSEVQLLLHSPKNRVLSSRVFKEQLTEKETQKLLVQNIANLFVKKGRYLQTFKLIYKSLGADIFAFDKKTLSYLFPFQYFNKIQKASGELDPLFVLSLIRQESAFNSQARSIAGARGLMQLMPATAREYRNKVKKKELYNPATNLVIGVKYLRRLLKKYDGNMIYALSAYNAGEGRVKRWKKSVFTASDEPLKQIESIPYKETRLYVKLIYRNLFFYNFLQNEKDFSLPIDQSFKVSMK